MVALNWESWGELLAEDERIIQSSLEIVHLYVLQPRGRLECMPFRSGRDRSWSTRSYNDTCVPNVREQS